MASRFIFHKRTIHATGGKQTENLLVLCEAFSQGADCAAQRNAVPTNTDPDFGTPRPAPPHALAPGQSSSFELQLALLMCSRSHFSELTAGDPARRYQGRAIQRAASRGFQDTKRSGESKPRKGFVHSFKRAHTRKRYSGASPLALHLPAPARS